MNPLSGLPIAFAALRSNKLRSLLTMLGIIIGVAAVIIMVAIGTARGCASPSRSRSWAPIC